MFLINVIVIFSSCAKNFSSEIIKIKINHKKINFMLLSYSMKIVFLLEHQVIQEQIKMIEIFLDGIIMSYLFIK